MVFEGVEGNRGDASLRGGWRVPIIVEADIASLATSWDTWRTTGRKLQNQHQTSIRSTFILNLIDVGSVHLSLVAIRLEKLVDGGAKLYSMGKAKA